eukprot:1137442-Pelagomonas_calceolata.AAC.9
MQLLNYFKATCCMNVSFPIHLPTEQLMRTSFCPQKPVEAAAPLQAKKPGIETAERPTGALASCKEGYASGTVSLMTG